MPINNNARRPFIHVVASICLDFTFRRGLTLTFSLFAVVELNVVGGGDGGFIARCSMRFIGRRGVYMYTRADACPRVHQRRAIRLMYLDEIVFHATRARLLLARINNKILPVFHGDVTIFMRRFMARFFFPYLFTFMNSSPCNGV